MEPAISVSNDISTISSIYLYHLFPQTLFKMGGKSSSSILPCAKSKEHVLKHIAARITRTIIEENTPDFSKLRGITTAEQLIMVLVAAEIVLNEEFFDMSKNVLLTESMDTFFCSTDIVTSCLMFSISFCSMYFCSYQLALWFYHFGLLAVAIKH